MPKYAIIVRDPIVGANTDTKLQALDCYFQSPFSEFDNYVPIDEIMIELADKYKDSYAHFRNPEIKIIKKD